MQLGSTTLIWRLAQKVQSRKFLTTIHIFQKRRAKDERRRGRESASRRGSSGGSGRALFDGGRGKQDRAFGRDHRLGRRPGSVALYRPGSALVGYARAVALRSPVAA